jgi:DNA-binding beta-propeller fold protein YncE
MKTATRLVLALLLSGSAAASAQIVVSANDGKQLRPGEAPSTRTADSVSVLDMRRYPPKTVATVQVPASMIGPPAAVAVARNSRFALVSAAQRLNAAGEIELNDTVSLIDISNPSSPKVLQTVQAGPGASGVTINRAGTLALVASTGDDTISVFRIAGGRLTPAGKVQLPAKTRPTDVAFAPNGKMALVVAQSSGKLLGLNVQGNSVTLSGREYIPGIQPYGVVFSPDGRFAYNTNLGGRPLPAGSPPPERGSGPRTGTISSVNMQTGEVISFEVGQTPEHVALSPDGRYVAAVVANGSAAPTDAPGYHPYGLLQIYRVQGGRFTPVAEAHSGAWCQGAVFSNDGRTVLLQCGMTKAVEVYRFDGKTLTQDSAATLTFDARPGSIATAMSR